MKQEINQFCKNWLLKYEAISENDLQSYFDKFFTLYVVYNRLYVEASYRLANSGKITLRGTFPDRKASIDYTIQFLTSKKIDSAFQENENVIKSIKELKEIIEKSDFNIKLHLVSGEPQPEKDADLLSRMNSNSTNIRIASVLEFVYSTRCNIFHAQKGYQERQKKILAPTIIILEKLVKLLLEQLQNE